MSGLDGQGDLFGVPNAQSGTSNSREGYQPLAARMRPMKLDDVVGQEHLLKEDALLPRLIRSNQFGSIFFYGPPGCGKTTLAEVIALETQAKCVRINAVMSNVAELRDVLKLARYEPGQTILFIDEIHRFNKSQQDLLLPDVEAGNIRLIGATTHNPGFYINQPLLSRSHLFRLEPLSLENLVTILVRALEDDQRGLAGRGMHWDAEALKDLARMADGDMRRALNALETMVLALPLRGKLDQEAVRVFAQERQIRYDANEDEHYNTASAFIKSIRGGDPDAALYWLAKMLVGGEDPRFIARRLIIFASEDVGLADSRALGVAVACMQACEFVGLPECELNLAHTTTFLALCPKSNSTTLALSHAKSALRKGPVQQVPLWLQDSHTVTNKAMGQGKGYRYSHDYSEGISGQEYMNDPQEFYLPGAAGSEAGLAERLARWKALKEEMQRTEKA
ncbi:MAG: replication-associated recombination protein A [Opitutales bacterium]|nr:replication-associated recombination protein A [Opitutales bacterium]NRA25864.1 replication-associated recombination protein A [Opitutales bacterium]